LSSNTTDPSHSRRPNRGATGRRPRRKGQSTGPKPAPTTYSVREQAPHDPAPIAFSALGLHPQLSRGVADLGFKETRPIQSAVLPYARVGIIGGVILGLGRALGETMAVTMLIGNRHELSASLFAPGYTMASLIANEFSEATNDVHLSALMAVGFVLLLITLVVNGVARWLVWQTGGSRS